MADPIYQPQIVSPEMGQGASALPPADPQAAAFRPPVDEVGYSPDTLPLSQAIHARQPGTGIAEQPQKPSDRKEFFRNMLSNFLYSFASGAANAGTGPGANQRGFGAAVLAPYQREQQQQQFDLEQRKVASQEAYQKAEAERAHTQSTMVMLPNGISVPATIYQKMLDTQANIQSRETVADKNIAGQTTVAQMKIDSAEKINGKRLDVAEKLAGENNETKKQIQGLRNEAIKLGFQNIGQFTVLTDEYGNVVSAWNPKTNQTVQAPSSIEGARKGPVPAEELGTRASGKNLIKEMNEVEALSLKRPDALGFVSGNIGELRAKYKGGDPEAASLYAKSSDVFNRIVYFLSGKAINQEETKRLQKSMPTTDLPPDTFAVRLKSFKSVMSDIYRDRTGKALDFSDPNALELLDKAIPDKKTTTPSKSGKGNSDSAILDKLKEKYGRK